jgi:hypothetical protein
MTMTKEQLYRTARIKNWELMLSLHRPHYVKSGPVSGPRANVLDSTC